MVRLFIALGLLSLLSACQTLPHGETTSTEVAHFVAVWLKDPADQQARERIAEQTMAWRSYPGVLLSTSGGALPSERKVVQDYDYGVLMVFESEAALRAYEQDPEHQQAIRDVLAPVAAKVQVYDFLNTGGTTPSLDRSELRKRQYQHYREFAN